MLDVKCHMKLKVRIYNRIRYVCWLTVMTARRGPSRTQRCGWTAYRNQHLQIHV